MAKQMSSTEMLVLGGAALFVVYKSGILQSVGQGVGNIGTGIGDIGVGLGSGLSGIGTGLGSGLSGLGNGVGGGIQDLGAGLGMGLGNLGTGIGAGVFAVGSGIQNIGEGLGNTLTGLGNLQTELGAGMQNLLTEIGGIQARLQTSLGTVTIGGGANVTGTLNTFTPSQMGANYQPQQNIMSVTKSIGTTSTDNILVSSSNPFSGSGSGSGSSSKVSLNTSHAALVTTQPLTAVQSAALKSVPAINQSIQQGNAKLDLLGLGKYKI